MDNATENRLNALLSAGHALLGIYHGATAENAIAEAARAAGKWCGEPAGAANDLRQATKSGNQLIISCGGDVSFLRAGRRETLAERHRVLEALRAKNLR